MASTQENHYWTCRSTEHTESLTCNSSTDCPTLFLASTALFSSTWSPDSTCLMPAINTVWSLGQITGTIYYKCPLCTSAWLVHWLETACNFFQSEKKLFTSQSSSSLAQSLCCVLCMYSSTQNKATKRSFYRIMDSTPHACKRRAHSPPRNSLLETVQLRSPRSLPWCRLDEMSWPQRRCMGSWKFPIILIQVTLPLMSMTLNM